MMINMMVIEDKVINVLGKIKQLLRVLKIKKIFHQRSINILVTTENRIEDGVGIYMKKVSHILHTF